MDSTWHRESTAPGTSSKKIAVTIGTSQDFDVEIVDLEKLVSSVLPCAENSTTTAAAINNCTKTSDNYVEESEACVTLNPLIRKLDNPKVSNFLSKLRFVLISIVAAIIIVAVVYFTVPKKDDNEDTPVNSSKPGTVPNRFLRFVERAEWGAQPPTEPLIKLELPVQYVIISHTATEFCPTQSECTYRVRFAQTFHIESRGWSDIAYNFLIGGMGYAYVGRGWDFVGTHSYNWNTRSIGISFIGTFNTFVPPKEQLIGAQELIEFGVKAGKIAPDYILLGHRQVSSTLSPGDALFNIIKTWPHWANIPSV